MKSSDKFCDECGGTMSVVDTKEKGKTKLRCDLCGNTKTIEGSVEDSKFMAEKAKKSYGVISDEEQQSDTIEAECPECGNDKAIVRQIDKGGFGVTEMVKKYTCTECGYSWEG